MRNLKKVLSVLLVVVIMATAMVPAFAAETFTYETQAKALNSVGLFNGVNADKFEPDLGSALTREQGFALIIRLLGKGADAKALVAADVDAALASFGDVKTVEPTLKNEVALAVKLGLVKGDGKNLDAKGAMLGKDFATVLLRQLGYADTEFAYDTATATLAEKGGLSTTEATKFGTKALIRDDLVGMAYGSLQAKYKTGETVIAKLIKDGVVKEADAIAAGIIAKPVAPAVSAAVTGAKIVKLTFSNAVDATKLGVTVKKGSIAYNVASIAAGTDTKSVVVTMSSNFSKGDYDISVTGASDAALTAKFSAEDDKVTKIEFTSDKATLVRGSSDYKINAFFKATNVFNEDVTKDYTFTFTTSRGTVATTSTTGMLEITDTLAFAKDSKVAVSALNVASGTFGSAVLTVSDKAQVADITIKALVLKDSKELDVTKADVINDYKLQVEAKDQYGNIITSSDNVESDVIVTVSDPTMVTVKNGKAANSNVSGEVYLPDFTESSSKVYLPLAQAKDNAGLDVGLKAGTTTIRIISKLTGKIATYDVVVKDGIKADVITLSAPELAPAGETFNVPFTAVDQFGNAITDATKGLTDLNATKITVTGGATAQFKQDYVKGVPVLEVNATSAVKGPITITIITNTLVPKVYSVTINLTDAKEGKVISSTKDFKTAMLKTGYAVMTKDNIIMKDQYGRDMSIDLTKYNVEFKTSDKGKVVLTDSTGAELSADTMTLTNSNTKIYLKAKAKGSSTITLKLYDVVNAKYVSNSELTFAMSVVEDADIASYELEDVAVLYDVYNTTYTAADYAKAIKVNGILADGTTKVAIPAELYNTRISYSNANITTLTSVTDNVYSAKASASNVALGGTDKTKTFAVVVTVIGKNNPTTLNKEITVSNVAPAYDKLSLVSVSAKKYKSEGNNVISVEAAISDVDTFVKDVVKSVDQYGVELKDANESYIVYVSNLPTGKTAGTVVSGDTFSVTAVTNNGKSITFKVIFK